MHTHNVKPVSMLLSIPAVCLVLACLSCDSVRGLQLDARQHCKTCNTSISNRLTHPRQANTKFNIPQGQLERHLVRKLSMKMTHSNRCPISSQQDNVHNDCHCASSTCQVFGWVAPCDMQVAFWGFACITIQPTLVQVSFLMMLQSYHPRKEGSKATCRPSHT